MRRRPHASSVPAAPAPRLGRRRPSRGALLLCGCCCALAFFPRLSSCLRIGMRAAPICSATSSASRAWLPASLRSGRYSDPPSRWCARSRDGERYTVCFGRKRSDGGDGGGDVKAAGAAETPISSAKAKDEQSGVAKEQKKRRGRPPKPRHDDANANNASNAAEASGSGLGSAAALAKPAAAKTTREARLEEFAQVGDGVVTANAAAATHSAAAITRGMTPVEFAQSEPAQPRGNGVVITAEAAATDSAEGNAAAEQFVDGARGGGSGKKAAGRRKGRPIKLAAARQQQQQQPEQMLQQSSQQQQEKQQQQRELQSNRQEAQISPAGVAAAPKEDREQQQQQPEKQMQQQQQQIQQKQRAEKEKEKRLMGRDSAAADPVMTLPSSESRSSASNAELSDDSQPETVSETVTETVTGALSVETRAPERKELGSPATKTTALSGGPEQLGPLIDQFLSGEYRGFTKDSPQPRYGLTPEEVVAAVLRALRDGDKPSPYHGAAVARAFSVPLARREQLRPNPNPWREIMRSGLTPRLFARRLRESKFRVLSEWDQMAVEELPPSPQRGTGLMGREVAVTLTKDGGSGRTVRLLVSLRKPGGLWLIDTIKVTGDALGGVILQAAQNDART